WPTCPAPSTVHDGTPTAWRPAAGYWLNGSISATGSRSCCGPPRSPRERTWGLRCVTTASPDWFPRRHQIWDSRSTERESTTSPSDRPGPLARRDGQLVLDADDRRPRRRRLGTGDAHPDRPRRVRRVAPAVRRGSPAR